MRSRIRQIFFFFATFILLVDGITFMGLSADFPALLQPAVLVAFWLIPLVFISRLGLYAKKIMADMKPGFFAGFYLFTGFFLACYVPKMFYLSFVVAEYALKPLVYIVLLWIADPVPFGEFWWNGPMNFISMLVMPLSVLAALVIFWGMLFGRFNYKVRRYELIYNDLPQAFDGYRIVHISDLHLGSLHGKQNRLRHAIQLINKENPDLILFTGDLVNNLAEETEGWEDLLSGLEARDGNYAILGNHDYGEYYDWPDDQAYTENMKNLVEAHRESGFKLLLNQSMKISRGNGEIYLAGVENWGLPPFKQYGDLAKALMDVPKSGFTILLSHDPSHWDAEVKNHTGVDLTLSGHTHGMQFGIRIGKWRWSPIQLKYPRWIGLYQQGNQYLHVNPGLGYIGYAGRIGIPPEISLITLIRDDVSEVES